jgi:esterase/lipase
VFNEDFKKNLEYINRFLPGNVRGTENVKEFVDLTKKELLEKQFSIENSIKELKNRKIKILIGEVDKITPTKEVYQIFKDSNVIPKVSLINCMDHECVDEEDMKKIEEEIISFLKE